MAQTLNEIVTETRRLIETGDVVAAMSQSGQAVAQMNNELARSTAEGDKWIAEAADLLYALDNHLRILFTAQMYGEVVTTALIGLSQTMIAMSRKEIGWGGTDEGICRLAHGEMLLLADALAALLNRVETTPPEAGTPEAEHLSAMIVALSSMLYHVYKRVLNLRPGCEDLGDVYQLLSRMQPLGAIRVGVDINSRLVEVNDNADNLGEIYGDLLGRAVAMGWFAEN